LFEDAALWRGLDPTFTTIIMPLVTNGGWYVPNGLMVLSPAAFFLIGGLIWALREWKPEQKEEPEFKICSNTKFSAHGEAH
jgi:Na+-transporting NADH:ubiquinone oxidoreductase subunit D